MVVRVYDGNNWNCFACRRIGSTCTLTNDVCNSQKVYEIHRHIIVSEFIKTTLQLVLQISSCLFTIAISYFMPKPIETKITVSFKNLLSKPLCSLKRIRAAFFPVRLYKSLPVLRKGLDWPERYWWPLTVASSNSEKIIWILRKTIQ